MPTDACQFFYDFRIVVKRLKPSRAIVAWLLLCLLPVSADTAGMLA